MKELSWQKIEKACPNCKKCKLHETRNNVVIGTGNKNADIMFIGEGPGYYEDQQAEPFVGKAGQLLDSMLSAIDLDRNQAYITNVVKCRPPDNRDPEKSEIDACLNFLRYQLLLVKPKIIVCLGRVAAKVIIDENFRITSQRGQWHSKKGYDIIATYHPSALLRDESKKKDAWNDLKSIQENLLKTRDSDL